MKFLIGTRASFLFLVVLFDKKFPGGSDGKVSACNVGDAGSIPGLGRSPGEEIATTPVFLPGKSHGQKASWVIVQGSQKSRTQLSD